MKPPQFQRPPIGVQCLLFASFLGSPELVVPISTIPYLSKITQNEEYLPFVVGVMGDPGSDIVLMDTVLGCLKSAGRPTSVHIGSNMFSGP